jgi:hypothetical protein
MTGDIYFDNLRKKQRRSWTVGNGAYQVILGTVLACYLDEARAPTFGRFCRGAFGPRLYEYWPDRFPDEPQTELFFLVMGEEIPRAEYPAIIEALEKLADGFAHDTIDPRVSWNRKSDFVKWTHELIALMRESLAAPPEPYDAAAPAVVEDITRRLTNIYQRVPTADEIRKALHLAFDAADRKIRPSEIDAVLRLEQRFKVELVRAPGFSRLDFMQTPSGGTWEVIGGDQIPPGTFPQFLATLQRKLTHTKADGIAMELAGRTPKEVDAIMQRINSLPAPLRAKIVFLEG